MLTDGALFDGAPAEAPMSMTSRDIIVVGASLGGASAVKRLCSRLPRDLPAALFVVWHVSPDSPGVLPQMLNDAGSTLRAGLGEDGEPIRHGRIYVAPPDRHLLLTPNGLRITRGPRENQFRPAVDTMFRSAAQSFGPRVVGIVLTGLLDDGTQGLWFVRRHGGVAIVQDPVEAEAPSMPRSAIDEGVVDHVLSVSLMPALLERLSRGSLNGRASQQDPVVEKDGHLEKEGHMQTKGESDNGQDESLDHLHPPEAWGPQVPVTCPSCSGALWTASDAAQPVRYRCHVGHQFSEPGLAAAKRDELELALWTALRALKESAALFGTMAARARGNGHSEQATRHERTSEEFHEKAQIIRSALEVDEDASGTTPA